MTEWQDEVIDFPHEFETEIHCLVTENHRLSAMQGIDQFENELSQEIQKDLAQQDDDFVRSEVRRAEFFCNDLRRAANHMALVSLVTRLDHWTLKFVRLLSLTTKKASPTANPTSKLARHM